MQIPFKPITLEDKQAITSLTWPSDYQNCDFSFANMCSWRFLYDSEFAVVDGFLLIRFRIEEKTRFAYMMPVGQGDLHRAIELIEADSLAHGPPLCMLGISPDAEALLEEAFPGEFFYIPERDYYDYIYLREDLATLRGRKFQAKRNHINNFKKRYPDYVYQEIIPDLATRCLELEAKWYRDNLTDTDAEELSDERRSMQYAFIMMRWICAEVPFWWVIRSWHLPLVLRSIIRHLGCMWRRPMWLLKGPIPSSTKRLLLICRNNTSM